LTIICLFAGDCGGEAGASQLLIIRAIRKLRQGRRWPEVGLGEALCRRMPTQLRVPRSPFVDSFRASEDSSGIIGPLRHSG